MNNKSARRKAAAETGNEGAAMMLPLHGALVALHCGCPLAALRVGTGCLYGGGAA